MHIVTIIASRRRRLVEEPVEVAGGPLRLAAGQALITLHYTLCYTCIYYIVLHYIISYHLIYDMHDKIQM